MTKKLWRCLAVWSAALLFGLSSITSAFAEQNASASATVTTSLAAADTYTIVALGDSISAGYEPGLTANSVPYGYVERLYEQALFHGRAEAVNYGIIGLRVEGLNQLLKGAAAHAKLKAADLQDFSMFPRADEITAFAQSVADRVDELPDELENADLVTVVIGGNDFRPFLTDLIAASMDDIAETLKTKFPDLLTNYSNEYEKALRQIAAMAPNAKIVITDQYLPLPEFALKLTGKDPALYGTLYDDVVKPLTDTVDALADKLKSEGLNVVSVHLADRFKGAEGRMTHVVSDKDNHPTQDGYQAIAEAFAGAVWPAYRKPAPRAADVPISVIIKGEELVSDYKPALVHDRTFIALTDVTGAMGADLEWVLATKTAIFRQNGHEVSITIDADTMIVDGVTKLLDAPAYLRVVTVNSKTEGKTYVPLAVIANGLQYDVQYSKKLQTAFINW